MRTNLRLLPAAMLLNLSSAMILAAAFALGLGLTPLQAHHGTATSYDQTKTVTIEGTVTEFIFRNPHSALFVDVVDADGKHVEWAIEMFSPGLLSKQGYRRDTFKPGDKVTLEVNPSLVGEPAGECIGCAITLNGKPPVAPRGKGKGK